jgi:cyclase
MLRPRIIPCLLVHEGGLVKTVGFRNPKYVGDPINAVKIFNEKETDELIVLDIDASARGVEPDYKTIAHLAAECRMPLCYGGGIRSAEQAKRIIGLGVEKVSISAAALGRPDLIAEIAAEVGSQSVVVTLDVRKRMLGREHDVWTHNGQRNTKRGVLEVARQAQSLGAGEIVINSIESDGQMKGYDLALAARVREALHVPMTMLGGAGSLADLRKLIETCGVVGAAAGSLFVFKGAYRAVLISYPDPKAKQALFDSALHGG